MGTDQVTITVRCSTGTYLARAHRLNLTASCTAGEEQAANACADKVFGRGQWELVRRDGLIFIYQPRESSHAG